MHQKMRMSSSTPQHSAGQTISTAHGDKALRDSSAHSNTSNSRQTGHGQLDRQTTRETDDTYLAQTADVVDQRREAFNKHFLTVGGVCNEGRTKMCVPERWTVDKRWARSDLPHRRRFWVELRRHSAQNWHKILYQHLLPLELESPT